MEPVGFTGSYIPFNLRLLVQMFRHLFFFLLFYCSVNQTVTETKKLLPFLSLGTGLLFRGTGMFALFTSPEIQWDK